LKAYLDTSVIVALLIEDRLAERASSFLSRHEPIIFISDFAAAEFSATLGRRIRMRELTKIAAKAAISNFDSWRRDESQIVALAARDVVAADGFLRRLDLTLLAPDALHIAICQRIGAALATFDEKMAASARVLGVDVAAA
jgi:predicted nucleic acid-binding protein